MKGCLLAIVVVCVAAWLASVGALPALVLGFIVVVILGAMAGSAGKPKSDGSSGTARDADKDEGDAARPEAPGGKPGVEGRADPAREKAPPRKASPQKAPA